MTGTINSSFVSIATLVKSNLGERCLINILINISSEALKDYLEYGKICKGASSKKKNDLVEMIVYRYITDKISKLHLEDISETEAPQILKQNNIIVKSLPGYGNMGLTRKEIMTYGNRECSIKISE